jgi:dTDP-4-amino-4,6-dideoxygalactose transaminase
MSDKPPYVVFGKPSFTSEEAEAVARVLASGWVGLGPETLAFEQELATYAGAEQAVALNSCTSSLFLSLKAHGVGPGDEVVCPSLTWCSTANVALHLGARPVFCDIDADTLCASPETVAAALTPKTKAVIVVHFAGRAIDVGAVAGVLPPGVALIEDAAHALGSRYPDGGAIGSSGNYVCFSFYANKALSTGDGGAIVLNDPDGARRLQSLAQHATRQNAWGRYRRRDQRSSLHLEELGYKMSFTDLLASIARVQLRRQDEMRAHRQAIAGRYQRFLEAHADVFRLQSGAARPEHAHHLYSVRLQGPPGTRDRWMTAMRARAIGASIHYPPLHRMPLYGDTSALPTTEAVAEEIMTLPIGNGVTMDDAERVMEAIAAVLAEGGP